MHLLLLRTPLSCLILPSIGHPRLGGAHGIVMPVALHIGSLLAFLCFKQCRQQKRAWLGKDGAVPYRAVCMHYTAIDYKHAACELLSTMACWLSCAACSVDGLGSLMQAILDARKAAAEEAAAKQAANSKPSAVDTALKQAGKQAAAAAGQASGDGSSSAPVSAATLEAAAASGANTLDLSVRLLAGMRWAGLEQLDAARGGAKKLAVYR